MPSVAVMTSFTQSELPGAKLYLKDFTGANPETLLKKAAT